MMVSQDRKTCCFKYEDGKGMCPNVVMWNADYCILHIDNKYAVPDAVPAKVTED